MIFERDSRWIGSSPEVDARWYDEYIIGTEHSIRIDNPQDYGLEPGTQVKGDGQWFSLSMYHQVRPRTPSPFDKNEGVVFSMSLFTLCKAN